MKIAEEILKKHTEGSQWYAPVCDARVLKAMEEYASQYKAEIEQLKIALGYAKDDLKDLLTMDLDSPYKKRRALEENDTYQHILKLLNQ